MGEGVGNDFHRCLHWGGFGLGLTLRAGFCFLISLAPNPGQSWKEVARRTPGGVNECPALQVGRSVPKGPTFRMRVGARQAE